MDTEKMLEINRESIDNEKESKKNLSKNDGVDPWLGMFVMLAEKGVEVGATLVVSGNEYTGLIISRESYCKSIIEKYTEAKEYAKEEEKEFYNIIIQMHQQIIDIISEEEKETDFMDYNYIHLKTPEGFPMRYKLRKIDGYVIANKYNN